MAKSKKEKEKLVTTVNEQLNDTENADDSTAQEFSNAPIVLMPELEELVKKNPNRLIGCGG